MSKGVGRFLALAVGLALVLSGCRGRVAEETPATQVGTREARPDPSPSDPTDTGERPHLLTVACPEAADVEEPVDVVFRLRAGGFSTDTLRSMLDVWLGYASGLGPWEVRQRVEKAESRVADGEARVAEELSALTLVAFENRSGQTAAYAATTVSSGEEKTPAGAIARYFYLTDWLNEETGALELELDPACFSGEGELCVTVRTADGDDVAAATLDISFEHPAQRSGDDE